MKTVVPAEDLWQGIIRGYQEAFHKLYDQYVDMLYAYGMKCLSDEDLVKDCIHDLFIDLYTYRNTLAPEVNIKFYLMRSLKRKLIASLKKSLSNISQAKAYCQLHPEQFSITFNAEDALIANERQQENLKLLIHEMNLLPGRQKEVLYLRFNSELEYDEIASMMSISVATCRTLVYRAVKQLRYKLQSIHLMVLFFLIR